MSVFERIKQELLRPGKQRKIKDIGKALGVLTKKSVFDFGKYKGLTIKEVLKTNPAYILWVAENTARVFSPDVMLKARKGKLKQDGEYADRKALDRQESNGNHWRGAKAHWTHPDEDYDSMEWDWDCPGPWGEGS